MKKEHRSIPLPLRKIASVSFRSRAYRFLRALFVGFILASLVNLVFSWFFFTPKMYRISKHNSELIIQYKILQDKIDAASRRLDEIKQRDNTVYRSLFGIDTLAVAGIYTPYPRSKYSHMESDHYAPLMIGSWHALDALGRSLYLESRSLDQLQPMAKDKELMATAIPAIMPINRQALRGVDRFGWRNHPIYHRFIFHKGIDLGSPDGTPVYAPGDATVVSVNKVGTGRVGYGKQVLLDHGFGYRTRFAHLSKILVEPGQKVRRGELIAEVGRTGGVSGPHLHYEVIYMGQPVNPVNYFRKDMDQADFERIIESANSVSFETEHGTNEGL